MRQFFLSSSFLYSKSGPFSSRKKNVNMITTTITSGLVMVILTPIENAVGVVLNLEFNTHLNISKLLSLSLLRYKTNDLFLFNIPINMYSKDQKCGTSDLKCQ